jgi:hypothetical protein
MNLKQMAAQAREHWKVTNPEIYRQMVEDKALEGESEAAAKLTMREIKTLMLGGLTEAEAWQESRHLFIFKTAEALEKAYQPERDENGKVMQPDWQREGEPLPKQTSTPLKSTNEKIALSFLSAMTTTDKPPKDKPQDSLKDRLMKMWQENDDYSDQTILNTLDRVIREKQRKKSQEK